MLVLEFQGRPERQMALRTTVYCGLAVQELLRHDKELASGNRNLAVASLVLHHGDRKWNAPTRLRDQFHDSAPDTYQVVSRRPPDATFEGNVQRGIGGGGDDADGGDGF